MTTLLDEETATANAANASALLSERLREFRMAPEERSAWSPARKRRSPILLATAIAILLGVVGTGFWLQSRSSTVPAPVPAAAASPAPLPASAAVAPSAGLDVSGFLYARRQATLSSKISGIVKEVLIEEGDRVRQSDPLVILDDQEARNRVPLARVGVDLARAGVAEAENELARVQEAMKRSERLASERLVSESSNTDLRYEVEGRRRRLRSALLLVEQRERELDVVQAALENTVIRAPFDGVIVATTVQPGEVVAPLSAVGASTRSGIGTIIDPSTLEVRVEIAETLLSRVAPGQRVLVRVDAYPDLELEGAVVSVAPLANRGAASVSAYIRCDRLDARLLPNMAVTVSWRNPTGKEPKA